MAFALQKRMSRSMPADTILPGPDDLARPGEAGVVPTKRGVLRVRGVQLDPPDIKKLAEAYFALAQEVAATPDQEPAVPAPRTVRRVDARRDRARTADQVRRVAELRDRHLRELDQLYREFDEADDSVAA